MLQIWRYVAERNGGFAAADRLIDRFESTFRMLADQPYAGRERAELGPGVRSFPCSAYVIFYRPAATRIEIVRVLSGYRDIEELLEPDS